MQDQQIFNEEYKAFLTSNGKGLDIPVSDKVMELLRKKFEFFIKLPRFRYKVIEYRQGKGYFEAHGLSIDQIYEVEEILTNNKE